MDSKTGKYIVIEGPIGVGKTSLAKRLSASFGSDLLLEQAEENPFLEKFYRNPGYGAFPTQLFFLFQRARQMAELRQGDMFKPVWVSDFLLDKDRLFARMNLDNDEYLLYEQVFERLAIDAPEPDLVIYLQASVDVLLERITLRGIEYEQSIKRDYLERLMDSYSRFFHDYDRSPLLIVNAGEIDLVRNETDYEQLFDVICKVDGGRHYFNPGTRSLV
jgi:deoxyguanosine kinase